MSQNDTGLHLLGHHDDASTTPSRKVAMHDPATIDRVDASLRVTGLILRLGAYAMFVSFANNYSFGHAMLTGVLVGDLLASLVRIIWQPHERILQTTAELALLGLIYLWVRNEMVWGDDQATRAILGLAALGVFAVRTVGTALTRLGPSENGFA